MESQKNPNRPRDLPSLALNVKVPGRLKIRLRVKKRSAPPAKAKVGTGATNVG